MPAISRRLIGTPGYRHTIGVARVWHFINVHGFILCGVYFVTMLFTTEQWKRLVPTSPTVILQAWNTWVHYATFHLPAEPNGFYGYNACSRSPTLPWSSFSARWLSSPVSPCRLPW